MGAFRQVLSFIASFFPEVLPSESQPPHLASWFQGFGEERRKEPRVYLSCFHKIKELMIEIDSKVTSNAKDQRRSRSVLPTWDDIYRLCDLPSSHAAGPLNHQYSRLRQKSVPSSRYVSLSLEDCASLRGLVESQSFASWAMASLFAFLRDAGLSPDEGFNKVVSSLSVALTAQAKASFAAASFLKQVRWETYVAHLPAHTPDSVKHALLLTPSEESLFSEEVIQRSLGQVRDDSQLQLLRNLSSQKSEKSSTSSSVSTQRHRCSPGSQQSASSSSRDSQFQSRSSRGYKRAASVRRRSPKRSCKSLAKKANFQK